MATFNERIQVVIDVVSDKATKGFKDFRTAVGEAEGFTGKLKAGVSSLGGVFGAAATGPAAMGLAVAAAGKFAADAVTDYANLGVQVADFAAATGLATEDASRWVEVSGDLGISADALQSTLGKLNKTIDPKLFDDLGVSIARTSSGAVDVNATFLNVIDRLRAIKDPAEQARVGAQLLGKGWQSVAPLISRSAQDIKSQLTGVASVKVFSEQDTQRAQSYQATLKDLSDKFEEIAVRIGQKLLPVAEKLAQTLDIVGGSNDGWDKFQENGTIANGILYTGKAVTDLGDSASTAARYAGLLADQQQRIADHTYNAKDSLDDARNALKRYQDQIKGRNDLVDLVVQLDDIKYKLDGLTMTHAANMISDRDYWLQSAQLTGDAQQAVSDYIDTFDNISPAAKTELLVSFDPNNPAEFFMKFQAELNRRTLVVGAVPGYPRPGPQDGPNTDPRARPSNSGGTTRDSVSGFSRSTSVPVNITVNAPVGANLAEAGRQVADALRAYYANGGEPV